ncbi:MAG: Crp/Fnr family transcriptional regulator [Deltaproteobacteria bacterium]|nr:Crp/Fnr family transcriptional regulator [Deltaproteobacteria bacterium]
MPTAVADLQRHPAFAAARPRTLRALAARCAERVVERGDVLAHAGTPVRALLLVLEGALELSHGRVGDRRRLRPVLLGRIEAPTLFGDASWYGGGTWPVTARAALDGLVALVPPRLFDRLLDEDPGLAAGLYRAVNRRHFRSIVLRRTLVLHETGGQILDLLERAPPEGWTTTALARSLGVARTTVWRQLKRLAADGVVRLDGGPRLAP